MNTNARALLTLSLVLGLGACGGAQFTRDEHAKSYKALPFGAQITVAATLAELPQPIEVLGTMAGVTRNNESDRAGVEHDFGKTAAAQGCDAIAELTVQAEETHSTKTVKTIGPNGAPITKQEQVVGQQFRWNAKCVRTAAAPIEKKTAPRKAAPGAAPAPAAEPAAPAPSAAPAPTAPHAG